MSNQLAVDKALLRGLPLLETHAHLNGSIPRE